MRWKAIQGVAKRLFLIKGFQGTTMEEIANEAELSLGTIYQYFKSKDELYASLNLITLEFMKKEIEKIHDNPRMSVDNKILRIKEILYKMYEREPLVVRNIFHLQLEDTLSSISGEVLDRINSISREVMNMIADIYNEGVQKGDYKKGHGILHADIIWGLFTGLVVYEEAKTRINPRKKYLKATIDKAFEIFIQGVKQS
jgi:AcrR family transcriptional regulator